MKHGPPSIQRTDRQSDGMGSETLPPFNTSNLKPHHVGSAHDPEPESVFRGRRAPRARVRGLPTMRPRWVPALNQLALNFSPRGSNTELCSRGRRTAERTGRGVLRLRLRPRLRTLPSGQQRLPPPTYVSESDPGRSFAHGVPFTLTSNTKPPAESSARPACTEQPSSQPAPFVASR